MQCQDPQLFPAAVGRHDQLPLYGHLIGNQWVASETPPLVVLAPATGRQFAWLASGGAHEINTAVQTARKALSGTWGKLTATERGRLMLAFSALVLANTERLAWIEAHDTGKPISQARADMRAVARYFEFYAGAADKVHGEVIPYLNGYNVMVVREPLGVTAHITPWNYPAQMFGRTIAPACSPRPVTIFSAPGGKPASTMSLPSSRHTRQASSAGLSTAALPMARAGAMVRPNI